MADLSEFVGDTPMRASLVKKRAKEQEKLDKIMAKAAPTQAVIDMYSEMIAAIDKRLGCYGAPPIIKPEHLPDIVRIQREAEELQDDDRPNL